MTNVAGVTTRESGRAADMQMKTDYFNEQLGDGHLMMLSGTPVYTPQNTVVKPIYALLSRK